MADKGIIFSAPMVRALLDGRKTQTRRLCAWADNPNNPALSYIVACDEPGWFGDEEGEVQFKAGYAPSDRLYVRESFFGGHPGCPNVIYRADQIHAMVALKWIPSIHMPRSVSRLWLKVTEVRVERLQSISEADAVAEGIYPDGLGYTAGQIGIGGCNQEWSATAQIAYANLWRKLHTKPGTTWADNPWVVAITFSVNKGNIDG